MPNEEQGQTADEALQRWETHCADPESDVDELDYEHFLLEDPTPEQLSRFLRPFHEREQLYERLHAHLESWRRPPTSVADEILTDLARRHVRELREQVREIDRPEFVEQLDAMDDVGEVVVVDRIDSSDRSGSITARLSMELSDAVYDTLPHDHVTWGLVGVVQTFAVDDRTVWHLLQPMIPFDTHLSDFYELWKLGADCAVVRGRVLVARPQVG